MNKYLIPAAVLVIIVLAVIATNTLTNSAEDTTTPTTTVSQAPENQQSNDSATQSQSVYNDGTYQQAGNYVSPGGPREVNVSVTLDDGVITDATFEGLATDPTSQRFQGEFADNYKLMVVGKNIDEVELTKVAGSSLTPKGFNDAISKIKEQAQS